MITYIELRISAYLQRLLKLIITEGSNQEVNFFFGLKLSKRKLKRLFMIFMQDRFHFVLEIKKEVEMLPKRWG